MSDAPANEANEAPRALDPALVQEVAAARALALRGQRRRRLLMLIAVGMIAAIFLVAAFRGRVPLDELVERAQEAERRGDRQRARSLVELALRRDPRHVGALVDRARQRARGGDYAGAAADIDAALAVDPAAPDAWLLRARLVRLRGTEEELAQVLEEGIARAPRTHGLLWRRADLRRKRGQLAEAEVDVRRALELRSSYDALFVGALVLSELDRLAEAREMYESMTRRWSREPVPWNNLCYVLLRLRADAREPAARDALLADARRAIERALLIDPDDAMARGNRARCRRLAGLFGAALADAQVAVRLTPGHEGRRAQRDRLRDWQRRGEGREER